MAKRVCDHIKSLRIINGLSRDEVALKLCTDEEHVSVSGVGRMERGEKKITITLLEKLSEIFDMTYQELYELVHNIYKKEHPIIPTKENNKQ